MPHRLVTADVYRLLIEPNSVLIVQGVLLIVLAALFVLQNRGLQSLSHIPGPLASHLGDIYRLFLAMDGQGPSRYRKLHERYGSVIRVGWNHVLIANPVYITHIYDTRGEFLKSDLYRVFSLFHDSRLLETQLNVRNSDEHKRLASQVSTKLSGSSFRRCERSFERCYHKLIELLKRTDGTAVDIQPLLKRWTLDLNTVMLFNHNLESLGEDGDTLALVASVDKGFRLGPLLGQLPYVVDFLLDNAWVMWVLRRVFKAQGPGEELISFVERIVRKLDPLLTDDDDCIYTSLRRELREGKANITPTDIMSHLGNLQLAGAFAMSSTLVSVFYFLVHNPGAYQEVMVEITEATAILEENEQIPFKDAAQLPYLEAIIMESLRLCPTNGLPLERIVPRTGMTADGVFIPPGTNVAICAPVVHLDCSIFGTRPDEFRPARWINDDPITLVQRRAAFLSFGKGRRSCAGHARSMMQVSKVVVEVLRRFDVEWGGGPEPWKVAWYWMPEQYGVALRFKERAARAYGRD